MKSKCGKCKIPAELACARCNTVNYCSRDCQVRDWPTHRFMCISPALRRESWVLTLIERIRGNILSMAAHYPGDAVFVELTETIDEFMNVGSLHIAHIRTEPVPNQPAIDNEFNLFVSFKDYQHTIQMKTTGPVVGPKPDQPWSIFVTI